MDAVTALPKLLFIGDAVVHSGFSRVTHDILDQLVDRWDIAVLGIVYNGDPHPYPYRIFTTYPEMGAWDPYGLTKLPVVLAKEQPDVIAILQDPWVVSERFIATAARTGLPLERTVAYMPVDSPTLQPAVMRSLGHLAAAVFYTSFGAQQALKHGFEGRHEVIPHGVDLDMYHPIPRKEARQAVLPGVGADAFVVGYVSRNQPRKRMDLALFYFAEWQRATEVDAYLWLHCDPHDPAGIDVVEFSRYLGIADRLIVNPSVRPTMGQPEEAMASIYSALDLHVVTSMAEGWALSVAESMACGIPNLVPQWGGLGEWAAGAAMMVPCTGVWATPQSVQGVVDREGFIAALDQLYRDRRLRDRYAKAGLALVSEERFRWASVADRFDAVFRSLLS